MQNPRKRCASDEQEINSIIDRILWNDNKDARGRRKICNDKKKCRDGYENVESNQVNCAVESSARFSLKVMEALRNLQRKNQTSCENSHCVNDIVNYIESNYRYDGDLHAQVLTVLPRMCAQGFLVKTGSNEYHHVGPFACMINENLKRELGNCHNYCNKKCYDSLDAVCLDDSDHVLCARKESHGICKKGNLKKFKKSCTSRSSAAKRTNDPYTRSPQNQCDRFSRGNKRDSISKEKSKECGKMWNEGNQREIELSSNDSSDMDDSSNENFFRELKSKGSDTPVGIINTEDKELKRWLRRCCRESKKEGTF